MAISSPVVALPLREARQSAGQPRAPGTRNLGSIELRFDSASNTGWITMLAQPDRPLNFSPGLLDAFERAFTEYEGNGCVWEQQGQPSRPIHYAVLRSNHSAYFNVGGDLAHFHALISRGDFETLRAYSLRCLDLTYRWFTSITRHTTTISLVQGRALGGGFETALSSDYLIAEEQAEFGLPEILFGLFPCSGGMSLLARRIGLTSAEKLMRSGRIYRARELLDLGVVDEVCPTGEGERFTRDFIAAHAKARPARRALERARRRMMPLDRAEMTAMVEDWVDTARQLTADNLRVLDTLVRMQGNDFGR